MPGRFVDSPDIIGKLYLDICDYPGDMPIAFDGNRQVYKGKNKVYLVQDGVVIDYFDWDIYGTQYKDIQKLAQQVWNTRWIIS